MGDTESGQEKTEPATPRRRQQAREKGQVPKSQEANSALLLLAALILFYFYAEDFYVGLSLLFQQYIANAHDYSVTIDSFPLIAMSIGGQIFDLVWPFALTFIVVAIATNLMQVGFLFSGQSLVPKFNKLNPANGIKRIFSLRGVMDTTKALAKMVVVLPVMFHAIYQEIPILLTLNRQPVENILIEMGLLSYRMVFRGLLILLLLAILDYIYQRYDNEQQMKMTKQEVKEEMKQTQGDPQIRSRIRSIQRDMARRRMMAAVPEAEVVVTNPTEYAVALSYKSGMMAAPQVVAKGRGYVARQIKEIAREHNIPFYEDRLLARTLYKLDLGSYIPPELYAAVAEVLAWVNHMTGRYQSVIDEAARERMKKAG